MSRHRAPRSTKRSGSGNPSLRGFLINLDPTIGSEIKKVRPCVVVSPDEMNRHIRTVIVAPMTTKGQPYPTRVHCRFAGREGHIAVDQLRPVDRSRLVNRAGKAQT